MRNKRYIKEIGMIHSVLLFVCSIFAVSGIMYASTTMVGLTIVSQEEFDMTYGTGNNGNHGNGTGNNGNHGNGIGNNGNNGNHGNGNNGKSTMNHGLGPIKKKFIIADKNTEKYNAPYIETKISTIGNIRSSSIRKSPSFLNPTKIDSGSTISGAQENLGYHGASDKYMCKVDYIYIGHGAGDLTPLQKAHNLLDIQNYTILHTDRTKKIYSRRFLFSEIIVL